MIQNLILQLGIRFSDEEKQKCVSTAREMVKLAILAEEEGVLGLESEVTSNENYSNFIKMGTNLILDAVTPDTMEKIFQHCILSGGYTGTELLEKLIMAEGLLLTSLITQIGRAHV